MNAGRTFALAGRVLSQVRRDPRTLALVVLVPVFILWLLSYLVGLQDVARLDVGLVVLDRGMDMPLVGSIDFGQAVAEGLADAGDTVDGAPRFVITDEAEAAHLLDDGGLDAFLVIPEDFTERLALDRRLEARVVVEGSDPALREMAPAAIKAALVGAVAAGTAGLAQGAGAVPSADGVVAEYLHGGADLDRLDAMAPALIAFFVYFLVFLLTCVAFMRERTSGTLERLRASPLTRLDISIGYMLGFGCLALLQTAVAMSFSILVLGVGVAGNAAWAFLTTGLLALGAVNLGVFCSTFADNELQAVQFIPIVIVPQALLCGLLFPLDSMPGWLRSASGVLPMTVGIRAMEDVMVRGYGLARVGGDLLWLAFIALAAAALSALSIGRRAS